MKWLLSSGAVAAATLTLLALHQSGDVTVAENRKPASVAAEPAVLSVSETVYDSAKQKDISTEADSRFPELNDDDMNAWLPRLNSDAIASMAQAREQGDARTPPIVRATPRQMPTADELADDDLYQKYEKRQEMRLYRAYIEASAAKIALIESHIEQARAGGISEEEIEFAKKKMEGIRAQSEQLLRDHPDLLADKYQSPDNWLPATGS